MSSRRIAVVGLGYVGLPLVIALARKFDTVGFDIDDARVAEIRAGVDRTREVAADELMNSSLAVASDAESIRGRDVYIVTVPTPIDEARRPDFAAMLDACAIVGSVMASGATVIFESTVYPGVTEEICGPALERASGLRCGSDFKLGYSPERLNPGDRSRPLQAIVKVVAGQDAATLDMMSDLYGSIIDAGVHRAPSIKVAEAAKVIENSQRDLNIALMNELSKICELIGIRSSDVLAAAGTKWNFLKFHPGLVGGHCIGVDPYYLTAKAEELGYHPQVILAGRRINDGMGAYIGKKIATLLANASLPMPQTRVGILGLTFKENVPDIRNSKVIDIIRELNSFGIQPMVHDSIVDVEALRDGLSLTGSPISDFRDLDALVLAVPHDAYRQWSADRFSDMLNRGGALVDLRSKLDPAAIRQDLRYWSL